MYKRLANNRSLNDKNYALSRVNSNKPILMLSKKHLHQTFNELRSNGKTSTGPDGISFSSLTEREWIIRISKLAKRIKDQTYKPGTTKPVNIVKPTGGSRTIQVSNHIDKIPQRACLKALTSTMEERFADWSYGFRPNRSHNKIFEKIADGYKNGFIYACHYDVVKAFDSVRISSLRRLLSELTSVDSQVMWLTRTPLLASSPHRLVGLNQGEALSGLLFNFYVNEFHDVKMDKELNGDVQIYRYADDLCVIGRSKELVEQTVSKSINYLNESGLNVTCDSIVDINEDYFELLGLTVKGNGHNIEYSLPESSWTRLSLSLDEAHNHPNPTSQIQMIVSGWTQALHPKILTVQEVRRVESIIRSHGINMNNLITNQD